MNRALIKMNFNALGFLFWSPKGFKHHSLEGRKLRRLTTPQSFIDFKSFKHLSNILNMSSVKYSYFVRQENKGCFDKFSLLLIATQVAHLVQ